jgi:hypothetical protein
MNRAGGGGKKAPRNVFVKLRRADMLRMTIY